MADRPTTSTSRAGRPRKRSRSVNLPSHIPVAPKTERPRANFAQNTQVKGKGEGAGKGKSTKKKLGKAVVVVSSDLEDFEVDFPHHPPNQPQDIPAEQPQEPNQPVNVPAEEPQEPDHPLDILVEGPGEPEGPQQPANVPVGEAESPQEPNNLNPLPQQPTIPMANNQLNWSHFKPDVSGKSEEDGEAHLLRTTDWMTTHDFPDDQKNGPQHVTVHHMQTRWIHVLQDACRSPRSRSKGQN